VQVCVKAGAAECSCEIRLNEKKGLAKSLRSTWRLSDCLPSAVPSLSSLHVSERAVSWIHQSIGFLHQKVIPLSLTPSQHVLKEGWAFSVLLICREMLTNNRTREFFFSFLFRVRIRSSVSKSRLQPVQMQYAISRLPSLFESQGIGL